MRPSWAASVLLGQSDRSEGAPSTGLPSAYPFLGDHCTDAPLSQFERLLLVYLELSPATTSITIAAATRRPWDLFSCVGRGNLGLLATDSRDWIVAVILRNIDSSRHMIVTSNT